MSITYHTKDCKGCPYIYANPEGFCIDCEYEEDDDELDREEIEELERIEEEEWFRKEENLNE